MYYADGIVLYFYLLLLLMTTLETTLSDFPYKIILASASPRRQELLKSLGFSFSCQPINADESWPNGLQAQEIPLFLSELKANAYTGQLADDQLLITADTVVWCENKVFNKPA